MKLSSSLLIRKVGEYTHVLNPFSGKLVTLLEEDFERLAQADEKDVDDEILGVLTINSAYTLY